MEDTFDKQKRQALNAADLSRKGSVDKEIVCLVAYINDCDNYCTTSSCSGRIIVFEESQHVSSTQTVQKKGCIWLYTSHETAEAKEVVDSLQHVTGNAVFKFEPFVLHVQCKTLQDAQLMLSTAVASGFRNSGISVSNKGKYVVAVRSTHSLEVPLTQNQQLLVSEHYISVLVELANSKMLENFRRIQRFFDNLKEAIENKQKGDTLCSKTGKKNKEIKKLKGTTKNFSQSGKKSNNSSQTYQSDLQIPNSDTQTGMSESQKTCPESIGKELELLRPDTELQSNTDKSSVDENLVDCFLFNS